MGKKKQVGMMMKRGGKLELKGGGKVMKGKKKKVMKKNYSFNKKVQLNMEKTVQQFPKIHWKIK